MVFHKFLKKKLPPFLLLEYKCMSLFVSTGWGCKSTHTHCVLHIVSQNQTMKKHIVQQHNAGIVDEKRTIHGTLCPTAPPEGTDLPKLPARTDPTKIAPRKPVAKKGIEGALVWRFETDISAKIWQMRPLWNMRSASQSAGANVTNG